LNILPGLGEGLLFALACNLDTVLAAVGASAKGESAPRRDLAVAAVTSAVTLLSLLLGEGGGALLPAALADRLGGLALAGLGLWYILDSLRGKGEAAGEAGSWLALSAALAVNNAGVGVAAGISGVAPLLGAGCNFALTLLALEAGRRLGSGLRQWSRWALPLSGVLLTGLGLWQLR